MTDLPSIFNFYSLDQFRQYHASTSAVRLFGHDRIIECIELARSDETGEIRDYNADAFPVDGAVCLTSARKSQLLGSSLRAYSTFVLFVTRRYIVPQLCLPRSDN